MVTNAVLPAPPEMEFAVRWTRAECAELEAAGFLSFWYELIGGIIIRMEDKAGQHRAFVERVDGFLAKHFEVGHVLVAHAVSVSPSENNTTRLVPDNTLLNRGADTLVGDEPRPEDILLLVEVSYSTLDYDLTTKAGVYARAGIAQYFVIDVAGRVVYDHLLTADGTYAREMRKPGDALTLVAAPDLPLLVNDWLLPG